VVAAIEATLLNNLGSNGFTLKLASFGKFSGPPQGGDTQEDSVHGRDDPDKGQTEDHVRQSWGPAATGAG
jgi:hypothetical protein